MKTFKQRLIDTPQSFTSEADVLHTFFSEHLNAFCLEFNAKLFTFKTWNGFLTKRNYFVNKYRLTLTTTN